MKKFSPLRLAFSIILIAFVSILGASLFNDATLVPKIAVGLIAIGMVMYFIPMPKGAAFDFTISDTTYAGEVASGFIVKAITGAETVQGGDVYVKDGIKKKFTIPRFSIENLIQDRSATPSSQGGSTIDGRVLDPQDYMIYMEFNPRDFEDHWEAINLNPALLDRSLPATPESVLVQEVSKFHANYFDRAIWQNSLAGAAPYNKFDGIITKATADADIISVASPVALTSANIADKFEAGYVLIPNALLFDPNQKIIVSYKTAKLWQAYQQAQTYKGVDVTSRGEMFYKGIKIVPRAGFPDDTYLIAKGTARMDSNLWVGINSTQDNSVQLAKLQANSELYFIKMLFKADTQIGWGQEAVLYKA